MPLPKPTTTYVRNRLKSYMRDRYYSADPAIDLVFGGWPENREHPEVLAKVTVLNALYGTRIMDVYPVVDRILALNIDGRLRDGDETLVDDVAHVKLGKKTGRRIGTTGAKRSTGSSRPPTQESSSGGRNAIVYQAHGPWS